MQHMKGLLGVHSSFALVGARKQWPCKDHTELLQAGLLASWMSHTWPMAYPCPQLLVHWVDSHWRCLHVYVP